VFGKTTVQQQAQIHTGEVFFTWEHLVARYEVYELLDIFHNFASDIDFKALISIVLGSLKKDIAQVEDELNTLGVPLPTRPPKSINSPANTEVLRDEFMFRILLRQFQSFINEHASTSTALRNQRLKELFFKTNQEEIKSHSRLVTYGDLKGWVPVPPTYKISKSH